MQKSLINLRLIRYFQYAIQSKLCPCIPTAVYSSCTYNSLLMNGCISISLLKCIHPGFSECIQTDIKNRVINNNPWKHDSQ